MNNYKQRQNQFRKVAKKMFEKQKEVFGYIFCERCGSNKNIDAPHHIIFKSEKPGHNELNNEKNLIILCRECHNYFHSGNKKERRENLVKNRKLYKIFNK